MTSDRDLGLQLSTGHCPDCGHRGFVLGPRGGMSRNIECGGCGHRFNVVEAPGGGGIIFAERISEAPQEEKAKPDDKPFR
jgi:ribosomal protein S27E